MTDVGVAALCNCPKLQVIDLNYCHGLTDTGLIGHGTGFPNDLHIPEHRRRGNDPAKWIRPPRDVQLALAGTQITGESEQRQGTRLRL